MAAEVPASKAPATQLTSFVQRLVQSCTACCEPDPPAPVPPPSELLLLLLPHPGAAAAR
jgi:hypothetical protein